MRRSLSRWILLSTFCLAGCGDGTSIWVTGVLQKGGEVYKPPEGRKLALYFYPMIDDTSGNPAGDPQMANYDARDGSFSVPGREGYGIPPGKYRIVLVETLLNEALEKLRKIQKPKRGEWRASGDTNFLEGPFGEKTSPFVRDLKTSTKLALDMARPTE
jgi:hypothetical protein